MDVYLKARTLCLVLVVMWASRGGSLPDDGAGGAALLTLDQNSSCQMDPLPMGVFEWKRLQTVHWGTFQNDVCNSTNSCFGLNSTQDDEMILQLKPVFVQAKDDVKLQVTLPSESNLSVHLYLVDEAGFTSCNISSGILLVSESSPSLRSNESQQRFVLAVPHQRLHLGANFIVGFVGNDSHNGDSRREADSCWNGLRLNITVKINSCQSSFSPNVTNSSSTVANSFQASEVDDAGANATAPSCSNQERCVADLHSTNFYCIHCKELLAKQNGLPTSPTSSSLSSPAAAETTATTTSSSSSSPSSPPSLLRSIASESQPPSPYSSTTPTFTETAEVFLSSSLSALSSSSLSALSPSSSALSPCACAVDVAIEERGCRCSTTSNVTTAADEVRDTTLPETVKGCPVECPDGGTCVANGNGTYGCQQLCPDGRPIDQCQDQLIDSCGSNPCLNGICVNQAPGYQCYCIPGYGGYNCQIKFELMCSHAGLCTNGGTCHEGDEPETFRCDCPEGFGGQDCSVKNDPCLSNPCVHICLDYGSFYVCECNPGFTGLRCETNINECDSSPCHNGGRCHDFIAGYRCQCVPGFHGTHCEHHKMAEMTLFVSSHHPQLHSLSMVAGTLAGAVLIALSVVLGCYCKVNGLCRIIAFKQKGYRKQYEDDRASSSSGSIYLGSKTSCRNGSSSSGGGTGHSHPDDWQRISNEKTRRTKPSAGDEDLREIYLDVSPLVDSYRPV